MQLIFFIKLETQIVESRNNVLHGWNMDKWVWLYKILKYMGRLVIRLKVTKYKEDSFYYLFFYFSNLNF